MSRRSFLQAGALAAGGAALAPLAADAQSGDAAAQDFGALSGDHDDVANASIAKLQSLMASHRLSAQELLEIYLRRIQLIDKGLDLRAIIQLNPDARRIAAAARPGASAQRAARSAARHPDPAERQHRHRRSPADDRGLAGAGRRARAPGCDGHEAAARCGRGDHRQGEPQRVGELPRLPELERLERRRPPVPQSAHSRSQSLRLQLRLRRCSRGSAHCRRARDGDRRLDRVPRGTVRRRRHQADGRIDEPRGRRADLAHAGHGRHSRTLARGCSRRARRAHRPGRARSADGRERGTLLPQLRQFINPDGLRGARIGVGAAVHRRDAGDRCDLRGRAAGHARRRRGRRRLSRSRRSTSSTPISPRSSC